MFSEAINGDSEALSTAQKRYKHPIVDKFIFNNRPHFNF